MPSATELEKDVVVPSPFTPKIQAKLNAQKEKAARDFRSDVVTVPVEEMMHVRKPPPTLVKIRDMLISLIGYPGCFSQ